VISTTLLYDSVNVILNNNSFDCYCI